MPLCSLRARVRPLWPGGFLPGSRSLALSLCLQRAIALRVDSAPAGGGRGAPRCSTASGLLYPGRMQHKAGGRASGQQRGKPAPSPLPRHAGSLRVRWALGWTKQPAAAGSCSRSRVWDTAEPLRPLPPAGSIWRRWGREPRLLLRPEPRLFQRAQPALALGVSRPPAPNPAPLPLAGRRPPTRAFAGSTKFGLLRGNFSGPTLPA